MTTRPASLHAALLAARIAHTNRQTATAAYTTALKRAYKAGATYTDLANTLGISRQAIRQYMLTN